MQQENNPKHTSITTMGKEVEDFKTFRCKYPEIECEIVIYCQKIECHDVLILLEGTVCFVTFYNVFYNIRYSKYWRPIKGSCPCLCCLISVHLLLPQINFLLERLKLHTAMFQQTCHKDHFSTRR